MTRHVLAHLGAITLTTTIAVVGAPGMAHADEIRNSQWHLESLGISDAHELSQGEGVTVGVVDTGVDATHPDLENNVESGKDFGTSTGDGLNDPDGHGTSTTSILAGHGHGDNNSQGVLGIAPKATIVSAGMDCEGRCESAGSDTSAAIKWLVDQEVDIISVTSSASDDRSDAVDYATDNGIPLVGAAGNTIVDYGPTFGVQEETQTIWPARARNAIPVSGVDQNDEFWEDSIDLSGAAPQPQYGLSAPATDLPGAMPGGDYATNSGTSGSAPIVAGTLALIKSAYPDLKHEQLMERLLLTVDDKGNGSFDDKYGWGIVNPVNALTEDVEHHEGEPSTQADILPLDEQGQDTAGGDSEDGTDEDAAGDGNPIAAATNGMPAWMIIVIIAGLLIVTAAIITMVVLAQRRKKHQLCPRPPGGATPEYSCSSQGQPNRLNPNQDWQDSTQGQSQASQTSPPGNIPPGPTAPFTSPE